MTGLPTRGGELDGGTAALPPFLVRGRWGLLGFLVGLGIAVAALSAATAKLVSHLSHVRGLPEAVWLIAGLAGLVAATAAVRVLERRVAERLGQDYVQEIRRALIGAALGPGRSPSLGITIARTSNDLNSVRNWVTLGVAGAVSGVPLIVVLTVALWMMAPPLAIAVMGPLLAAVVLLGLIARPTFAKARALRRARGRLAGQITDTLNAAIAIRAAGGEERELGRIDKLGNDVAGAAVQRATLAGSLRASAMGAASAAAVAAAATGALTGLDRGLVAAALTVVSMIAGPVHDLGRIVEYRQSYRAAQRSIAPALAHPTADSTGGEPRGPVPGAPGLVAVGLRADGAAVPELAALPGEVVLLDGYGHTAADELFEALLGLSPGAGPLVAVDGQDLASMPSSARRGVVGYAASGLPLERGQLRRALRYRHPDADDAQLAEAVARAGLEGDIAALPKGDLTVLRRGGEPLSRPQRAKVHLARAILAQPPLLLLNRIDADMDLAGQAALLSILHSYPGTVVIATDNPSLLPSGAPGVARLQRGPEPAIG